MLPVIFEDDAILVIDKPAGLPSQPGERVGNSVISVLANEAGFEPFPVNRLDKETAGCMLIAKNPSAASRFSGLLAGRSARKRYLAVCLGAPASAKGGYDEPLDSGGKSKDAQTGYRLLARFGRYGDRDAAFSLLEFDLGTGRTHQIRRHSAMHGHPILGDDRYGDFKANKLLAKTASLRHLLLLARRLELPGYPPFVASIPEHFTKFLAAWTDAPDPEDY